LPEKGGAHPPKLAGALHIVDDLSGPCFLAERPRHDETTQRRPIQDVPDAAVAQVLAQGGLLSWMDD
jgi:hypothetical protein